MVDGDIGHSAVVAHAGGVRAPAEVFEEIYTVFLALGTLVGIVVIGYTLYNAIKYRDGGSESPSDDGVERPTVGELPGSTGGGRKLFVSFFFSAVIVVSLILWTYSALLYIDSGPDDADLEVDVVGQQFAWRFVYPNGHESSELRIPVNQTVRLNVTSTDVMHNIGIPEFHAKTDAIPGQTTTTWFAAEQTGTFEAVCYELCGIGHSGMRSPVIVMEQSAYERWYENTTGDAQGTNETALLAGGDG